ncbi:unnamed protein product [Peronospora belbahrii]|uniref:Uncharacterized protein n=1 Tax=Peronospora belbahrii TaxID=622444 RepID=A0AAU9LBB8_9STRA|nr:unnamed protein product [Peronospora belbahrii]
MDWMNSVVMEWTTDSQVVKQVEALLLMPLSFLSEALRQSRDVTIWSLDKVYEWLQVKSKTSDVDVPEEEFLTPLVTHQATIQTIGEKVTAQEFRALHDVKRFEKRRVTIASATNSIIDETRTLVLESIVNVKMAAVELIEARTRQLAEKYAQAFEQALKDYERTLWQAEEEDRNAIVAEMTAEGQAQVDAAAGLKRYLSVYELIIDDKLKKSSVFRDQSSFMDEVQDKRFTGHRLASSQLAEQSKLSVALSDMSVSRKQSSAESMLGGNFDDEDESQALTETANGGLVAVELGEAPAMEHSFSQMTSELELDSKEQVRVPTVSEVSLVSESSLSEKVVEDDYISGDDLRLSAKHAETDSLNAVLESTDRREAISEVEQTFVTQVLVNVGNALLEAELMQTEVSSFLAAQNISEEDAQLQQQNRVKAQLKAPVDASDMKLVEELTSFADKSFEKVEVNAPDVNVRTWLAAQAGSEGEGILEKERVATTKYMEADSKETLWYDDAEIGTQSEQLNAESVLDVNVNGVQEVLTELHYTKEESRTLRNDGAFVERELPKSPVGEANEAVRECTGCLEIEENANGAKLTNFKKVESESVIAAREFEELKQLEQIVLQKEAECIRVEEELRMIAEKERIPLLEDLLPAKGEISHEDAVPGHYRFSDVTKRAEAVMDVESEEWQLSPSDTFLLTPRPALLQISLFSLAFFGLAALTVYLYARPRKHGFFAHSLRRRKRWQRHADIEESEAEEVVLLPDDSSDEEVDTTAAVVKQSSLKGFGGLANVEVEAIEAMSSGGEEDDENEKKSSANYRSVDEPEDNEEEDLDAERSHLIVTERVQTIVHTVDHPVASSLDAIADDDDTASISPIASGQKTPDTSQHARLRRRGIRT